MRLEDTSTNYSVCFQLLPFTDDRTETQRGKETCPRSLPWFVLEPELELGALISHLTLFAGAKLIVLHGGSVQTPAR